MVEIQILSDAFASGANENNNNRKNTCAVHCVMCVYTANETNRMHRYNGIFDVNPFNVLIVVKR